VRKSGPEAHGKPSKGGVPNGGEGISLLTVLKPKSTWAKTSLRWYGGNIGARPKNGSCGDAA